MAPRRGVDSTFTLYMTFYILFVLVVVLVVSGLRSGPPHFFNTRSWPHLLPGLDIRRASENAQTRKLYAQSLNCSAPRENLSTVLFRLRFIFHRKLHAEWIKWLQFDSSQQEIDWENGFSTSRRSFLIDEVAGFRWQSTPRREPLCRRLFRLSPTFSFSSFGRWPM